MKALRAALFLLLLTLAGSVPAEDVVLAVPTSLQPYFIPITDSGLAYETVEAAFATQGLTVRPMLIDPRDSIKHWDKIVSNDVEVACASLVSLPQTSDWSMVDDAYSFHDHAITLTKRRLRIDKVEDLLDKTVIAYQRASTLLGPELGHVASRNPRYREISNHRAQVQLLLRGRVDVIIADRLLTEWYLNYLANESGDSVEVTFHDIFPALQGKFACRDPKLTEAFSAGLAAIRANGTFDAIRAAYVKNP